MSGRLRSRFGDERGAVLVAGLLLSLALLIVIGAGVDIGHAFIVRRELVSLADDAALTGSQVREPAPVECLQVEVQRRVPTILLRLVGVSTLTVGAHATAAPREP